MPVSPVDADVQNILLRDMIKLPLGTAIGVCCAFLLHCAHNHRTEFRRVMNEKVVRDGFRGISLLEEFKRVSR